MVFSPLGRPPVACRLSLSPVACAQRSPIHLKPPARFSASLRASAADSDSWLEEFGEAVSGMVARHRNRTAATDRERAEQNLRMQRRFLVRRWDAGRERGTRGVCQCSF